MSRTTDLLRAGDIQSLREMIRCEPDLARKPQIVLDAARLARLDILKLLHNNGADLNARWRNYRALHALIQEQPHAEHDQASQARLQCLEWLLNHGADPELLGAWPSARAIIVAAFTGVAPFVERLLAAGARADAFAACALGDISAVVRELKQNRDFVNSRDGGVLTALQCCAGSRLGRKDRSLHKRLLETAAILLGAGANPNARTKSWHEEVDAAYFAISADNPEMLNLLLEEGADATSALISGVWTDCDKFGDVALRHGARINAAEADGIPLLSNLVRWGQMKPATWALGHGADPNNPDIKKRWTAVHYAASRGNARTFEALLKAGGDPYRKDKDGRTAADIARSRRHTTLVGLAIQHRDKTRLSV